MKKTLCSLTCLVLAALLLCGCGKSAAEKTELENIRLSNTKNASSSMSHEESSLLKAVSDILDHTVLVKNSDSLSLKAKNTSGKDLDIDLFLFFYNTDGTQVAFSNLYLGDWFRGEALDLRLNISTNIQWQSAKILAEYVSGGTFYQTALTPLPTESSGSTLNVQLTPRDPLPCTHTFKNWNGSSTYTLQDLSIAQGTSSDTFDITFLIHKDSGTENDMDAINYRILTEDGIVADTGYFRTYLAPGETLLHTETYFHLLPGNYVLELK